MPRFSECWRCGKVSATVVCPSCNVAKYCSTKCKENDITRHSDAECRPVSILKKCSSCHRIGSSLLVCTGCYRVFYCHQKCQKDHRDVHKVDCKSIVEKIKSLARTLMTYFAPNTARICLRRYYWGNVPAYDYLNLSENEGVDYNSDMNVLVLGVGDIRNIVITCASLPKIFTNKVLFTLNDSDRCVMARLVLFLYMMIKCDPSIDKVVTEIWYSTLLSETTFSYLSTSLQGLLGLKNAEDFMSATRQLVSLNDFQFKELQKVWKQWLNMNVEGTSYIREQREKQMNEDVGSFFGKISYYNCIPKEHVPSARKYMEDGVFQRTQKASFAENPTLTGPAIVPEKGELFTYCCPTSVLPFIGWDYVEVKKFNHADSLVNMFGNYIECQLRSFKHKLTAKQVSFEIILENCLKLDECIHSDVKYDRILTSNLMDYILLPDLLRVCSDKLNRDNPCATLITESLNWGDFCPYADVSPTPNQTAHFSRIVMLDTKNPKLASDGGTTFREYLDNSHEFQDYLRALFYVYQKRQKASSNSTRLPSLRELGNEFQLRLRDGLRNENRIVFFKPAVNRRRVTMITGHERYMEWVATNTGKQS